MSKEYVCTSALIKLSLPILASSFINTIIGMSAIPILGNYSVEALAASAIHASISMIFYNVLLASFTGYRILASKEFGANNKEKVRETFSASLIIALGLSVLMMLLIILFNRQISFFMSADYGVSDLTASYLKITAFTYPLIAITNLINISFPCNAKLVLSCT